MSVSDSSNHSNNTYEKIGDAVAIFQRGDVWHANIQHNGKQVRQTLKTKSKKEARRRALLKEKEILAGEYKHHRKAPPIAEVVEKYLDYLRAERRAPKTIGKYENCFEILDEVAGPKGITRISQIDLSLIDAFRAARAAGIGGRKPSAPKTVNNDTVAIRQLVNFALKRSLISDDPLKDLKIRKPRRTPQPYWTREQVDLILATAKPPQQQLLLFLAETGARIGEAAWLTWDDVDFERRFIHIRAKAGWKPKSGDERVVPISPRLLAMLEARERKACWVFTFHGNRRRKASNERINAGDVLKYLQKRILKKLKLPGHLHTFRHSFISFAAISGIAERVLRRWIGHVDQEVLDWYFHLADADSQQAMQRLSQAANQQQKGA